MSALDISKRLFVSSVIGVAMSHFLREICGDYLAMYVVIVSLLIVISISIKKGILEFATTGGYSLFVTVNGFFYLLVTSNFDPIIIPKYILSFETFLHLSTTILGIFWIIVLFIEIKQSKFFHSDKTIGE